jgi:hypothetical protein
MTILPQLERDLYNTAEKRLRAPGGGTQDPDASSTRRRRRSAWSRATGIAVPVIGVLVAVAVAAVALTAGSPGHGPTSPATNRVASSPSRQGLIRLLGVLRRPQNSRDFEADLVPIFFAMEETLRPTSHPTSIDRSLAAYHDTKLDRPLARVVGIPAWNAKVQLAPFSWQPSLASPQRSEGLAMTIGGPGPGTGVTGSTTAPATVATIRDHGFALMASVSVGCCTTQGVIVVPDGVARLSLGPFHLISPPVPVSAAELPSVTVPVKDNVAAFQIRIPTVTGRVENPVLWGVLATAHDTWFNANGKVIARTTTRLDSININVVPRAVAHHP